jgi:hypothetical protein
MSVDVRLDTGPLDNLIRNLGRESEKAAQDAAETIARRARERVPVRSGRLQRSLRAVSGAVEGEDYGAIVEERTPFLAPAVEETEPEFERALEQVVRRLGNG